MNSTSVTQSFAPVPSPLAGVASEKWAAFVRVMATSPVTAISASNAIGAFELSPRRLADLGVLKGADRAAPEKLKRTRGSSGRMIWTGVFVDLRFGERLKRSLWLQYELFCKSMADYTSKIAAGTVKKPDTMSLSGALAVLHCSGPKGLEGKTRFSRTGEVLARADGIF